MVERLEELELLRKQSRQYATRGLLTVLICWFLNFIPFLIFIGLALGAIMGARSKILADQYRTQVKELLTKDIFSEYFEDVYFDEKKGFSQDEIYGAGLVGKGRYYSSNDLLEATYKGVRFRQSDVSIQKEKRGSVLTGFKGQWIILDTIKHFDGYLRIRVNPKENKRKPEGRYEDERKLKKIELDHREFNEVFEVHGYNEHDAYYWLTPHLMDQMLKIGERFVGAKYFAFIGNQMHIAIDSYHDLYEPNVRRPLNQEYFEETRKDIEFIIRIIEELR